MDLTKRKETYSVRLSPDAVEVIREFLGGKMSLSAFVEQQVVQLALVIERSGLLEKAVSARKGSDYLRLQAELMEALELQNPEMEALQTHKDKKEG